MTVDMMDFEKLSDMPFEKKVWGEVIHVFNSMLVGVSVLRVKAGSRCSRHLHEWRANRFCIVSGKIEVWEWHSVNHVVGTPNIPLTKVVLDANGPERTVMVSAGTPHMFKVIEDGMVVEIYTPDGGMVSIDDIVRFDEGGPCD
jgi:hypothetical protein